MNTSAVKCMCSELLTPGRHGRAAQLEAVRDGEIDELLALRHARADDRVVELALEPGVRQSMNEFSAATRSARRIVRRATSSAVTGVG